MIRIIAVVFAFMVWPATRAFAQTSSTKPMRIIVPLFVRGGADLWGRVIVHVPYRGGAPAMIERLGGRVSMMFNGLPAVIPHVKARRLREIAVASAARAKGIREIATFAEAGSWYGVFAPAGTLSAVIAKLHSEVVNMLKYPDVQQRLVSEDADPIGNTPEQFAVQIKRDITKWGNVARGSGIPAV